MSKEPNIGIQFRARTEAPTEPGWYHGRRALTVAIRLVQVIVGGKGAYADFHGRPYPMDVFDWFGPITPVEEAST